jgi:DNA-binding GntR family transcriptional regulator
MPVIRRNRPPYLQIADHFRRLIVTGELGSGDRLPPVQTIAEDFDVASATAHQAIGVLVSEGLVHTSQQGTFVNGNRVKIGPQQRLALPTYPRSERIEVRSAEMVQAPEYVIPLLSLEPDADSTTRVVRREQVAYEDGDVPFMLAVSWLHPTFVTAVPELLNATPIPSPSGAAKLIEERTGRVVRHGQQYREARLVKDDGRECPLLRLAKGTACLAETYIWYDAEQALEYGEYVLIMNRVTMNDFQVPEV